MLELSLPENDSVDDALDLNDCFAAHFSRPTRASSRGRPAARAEAFAATPEYLVVRVARPGNDATPLTYPLRNLSVEAYSMPHCCMARRPLYDLYAVVDRCAHRGAFTACALDPVTLSWVAYDGLAAAAVAAPDHESGSADRVPHVLFYRRRDSRLARRLTGPEIKRVEDWVPRKKSFASMKKSHAAVPLEQRAILADRMKTLEKKSRASQSSACGVM